MEYFTGDLNERVRILTEGAKYDVSCSSSGSSRSAKAGKLGDALACGICHSFAADGRCVSLLKILLTNKCEYDCLYCANRRSNDVPRARLSPEELCDLTVSFYRRNYIEGLFLSSAVEISPDATMQKLTQCVEALRGDKYKFNGYIHLKAIPGADPALIDYAARFADRMSVNIELPSEDSLKLLAPQKKKEAILTPMRLLSGAVMADKEERQRYRKIPAGQTTQMIIGASSETDGAILRLSEALYRNYSLKRVYYSAYTPVNDVSLLPAAAPPLRRENRLYQADWLLRFYGFDAEEIADADGNLPLGMDPKCAWAVRNLDKFPVEINSAPYETLLRVPGIGVTNARRIKEARVGNKLTLEALKRMRVVLKRALDFITVGGKFYGRNLTPQNAEVLLLDAPERVTPRLEDFL